jgi:hypothetical protein
VLEERVYLGSCSVELSVVEQLLNGWAALCIGFGRESGNENEEGGAEHERAHEGLVSRRVGVILPVRSRQVRGFDIPDTVLV